MKNTTARSMLRSFSIPPDIIKWLRKRTESSCRSLNGEVVYILKQERDRESNT